MKFQFAIVLLAYAQLGRADDQSQSPPKASSRAATAPAAPAARSNTSSLPQAVVHRPVSSNPNVRPVYPPAPLSSDHRVYPINRNRVIIPNRTPAVASVPNRAVAVTPNQQRNIVSGNRPTRLPSRTGNELSFAQARAECARQGHDHDWWRHHHNRIVFYGGGYWFWNAGWWFPAWGYSPYYNNYVYDGPIYGFGELSPGDVTAQVQEALAQQGYYYGQIDGVLGPETRDAILRFQADHGLATTAAIDEPTLDSLGLT
jgi:Putative peptidoglycan binding domain